MRILGISAFYHDSAAVLIDKGKILAAAQEERFTRKKHDASFPKHAIQFCLSESKISYAELDWVVFYEKPFTKWERLLETYFAFAPKGFETFRESMPLWFKDKLFQKKKLIQEMHKFAPQVDWENKVLFSEHHLSHAASAFYPSPFERAAILTMDGVGEWTTTSLAIGNGSEIRIQKEIPFPHSIGLLYSAFTYYLGFKVNSGEYKVMGLAPYGEPKFRNKILENLIDIKPDGSFRLNMGYFDYCTGLTMTNQKFDRLFEGNQRFPEKELQPVHMDLAASIQSVTEEIILRLTRAIRQETGEKNLCLAGGVALNCVANGKIYQDGQFEKVWIQPAAGDAGGALGAALLGYYHFGKQERRKEESNSSVYFEDQMQGALLGPRSTSTEIERTLEKLHANFTISTQEKMIQTCVEALVSGKAVGWHQGRMEFGPRALGARSILADARSERMQSILNLKVKYRESFRPFAPVVLREDLEDWFEFDWDSPYMLFVAPVKKSRCRAMTETEKKLFGITKLNVIRSEIPAITHVDYSARIQTVTKDTNPTLYLLLENFKRITGCSVLVNTSFNIRGEPIVCSPEDSFRCFMGTDLDLLVIENVILHKENQNPALRQNYKSQFELD